MMRIRRDPAPDPNPQNWLSPTTFALIFFFTRDEELFLHYGYDPLCCPDWYRDVGQQFSRVFDLDVFQQQVSF
jgi:hypothetical protein